MKTVSLPQKPRYKKTGENSGKFEILGCYPGYGATLGNTLRRVLLSSLGGSAATSVKIKGVSHEFSTIPGVMEDAIQIILNLKKVRFKKYSEEPLKVTLKRKGEGKVTAKDIECSADIEVVNPNQLIATITDKKTELEMEINVENGLGYVPVEQQEKEDKEIGAVAIDAVFTPIQRVNFLVENMRVGKKTDYDKINLEITTDGSVTPQEAFSQAVNILVNQFSAIIKVATDEKREKKEAEVVSEEEKTIQQEVDPMETEVPELKNLSTRTLNVLNANKIKKIKDIIKLTESEISDLEGMGAKGIKEIKKAIGDYGLTLKQDAN